MPVNLSAAWESYRRGDFERAARVGEAALAHDPNQADALHLMGLVALRRGDPLRAAALFDQAVAVRPDEANYHASLAEACSALGQVDRAIECCQAACRLKPDRPGYHYNLGLLLMSRGELDAAIVHFRGAIELKPDFAWAHNNLGNALLLKGDKAAALDHLRRAVQLDPNSVQAHSNLGSALMNLGEPHQALGHYQEAARLRPDFAGAHNNLGNVFHALGRLDESEACYRAAIRLQPELVAAHAGLGRVLEELGELDQAIAALREALRHEPRNALVLARLATAMPAAVAESERGSIESLLASANLPPEQRWPLLFGLAGAVDARGEFDRAASLTFEANDLQRAAFRKRGMDYDPDAHRSFVDRLIAAFTPELFAQLRGLGLETERPVFVVGMPRSGTTLVEQILASHPRVFGAGELQLVPETFDSMPQATGRTEPPLGVYEAPRPGVHQANRLPSPRRPRGLERSRGSDRRQVAGKHLVPGAPCRSVPQRQVDPLPPRPSRRGAIVLDDSLRQPSLGLRPAPHRDADPRIPAADESLAPVLPVPMLEVDYEAMVADPERSSRELVAWCGLEWDPACLEFHKDAATRADDQHRTGPATDLPQLSRPVEELRAAAGRHVRPARDRSVELDLCNPAIDE